MASADTEIKTNQRYNPPSAERKLEKQLASVKANMYSLSATPGNWVVKKDPKLGTHYVLMLGKDGADHVNHFLLHRLIGQDYQINKKEAWVMSLAGDIPGFMETADFAGKPKVVKALSALKVMTAKKAGAISINRDGFEVYPDGSIRQEILDNARLASTMHAKVEGKTHFGEWILYLQPEYVNFELKIQKAIADDPQYPMEASDILSEYAAYQSSLIDGKRQQEVPYLYGVSEKDVMRTVYSTLFGMPPKIEDKPSEKTGVFPYKIYSDYQPGNESFRQTLVRELQVHAVTLKEFNIAKSELAGAKLKDQKAKKSEAFESKKRELADATNRILSLEKDGPYPSIVDKVAYEVYVDPAMTPKEVSESLRKSP